MKLKKFEWMHRVKEDGKKQNAIFIDGELFDWEIDPQSLESVLESGDPILIRVAQQDIEKHFLESLSEFVGRKITQKDIAKAEKTGWI